MKPWRTVRAVVDVRVRDPLPGLGYSGRDLARDVQAALDGAELQRLKSVSPHRRTAPVVKEHAKVVAADNKKSPHADFFRDIRDRISKLESAISELERAVNPWRD